MIKAIILSQVLLIASQTYASDVPNVSFECTGNNAQLTLTEIDGTYTSDATEEKLVFIDPSLGVLPFQERRGPHNSTVYSYQMATESTDLPVSIDIFQYQTREGWTQDPDKYRATVHIFFHPRIFKDMECERTN